MSGWRNEIEKSKRQEHKKGPLQKHLPNPSQLGREGEGVCGVKVVLFSGPDKRLEVKIKQEIVKNKK